MAMGKLGTTLLAGTVLAGGITIGAVTFNGTDEINDIRNDMEDMATRIVNLDTTASNYEQALSDLQNDANAIIEDANSKISEKNGLIGSLKNQIASLQDSISGNDSEKQQLTDEINRLNSELEKANGEVSSLHADAETFQEQTEGMGETVKTADSFELPDFIDGSTVYNQLSENVKESLSNAGLKNISDMHVSNGTLIIKADRNTLSTLDSNFTSYGGKEELQEIIGYFGNIEVYTHEGELFATSNGIDFSMVN